MLDVLLTPVALLGRAVLSLCRSTGQLTLFLIEGLSHLLRPPFYVRLFWQSFVEFAYFSLPVVALTAVFTGMVLALQASTGLSRFNAESAIANLVVLSMTRELGPVLTAVMVAGRVGAAMAAQIGTMRVTDQIDALSTLSTNPMKYLVTPRLLAGAIAVPLLVVVADILGVLGGYLVAVLKLGFSSHIYLKNTYDFMTTLDVVSGLVKAVVFGVLVSLLGCYNGYRSKGGAEGVGAATTSAVVTSCVLIFFCDYILTEAFFTR
jgi:phospholipid/cholesterol/gamma-HCH transport system permease protein